MRRIMAPHSSVIPSVEPVEGVRAKCECHRGLRRRLMTPNNPATPGGSAYELFCTMYAHGARSSCSIQMLESKASDSRNQWHELIQCGILPQTVQGLQTDLVHLMRSYPRQADGATTKLPAWREITSPTQHSFPGANRLVSALGTNLEPLPGALGLVLAPIFLNMQSLTEKNRLPGFTTQQPGFLVSPI